MMRRRPQSYRYRRAEASVLSTWSTWWAAALYEARIRAGLHSVRAESATREDVAAYRSGPDVPVLVDGERRACPVGVAVTLAKLGVSCGVTTSQGALDLRE